MRCNDRKYTAVEALDPVSGKFVPLFDRRSQKWNDHFLWTADLTQVVGRTAVGRAAVVKLALKEKRELRNTEVKLANHVLKKARIPRQERREAMAGRASPKFMEDLRAAIQAAERKEKLEAGDATPGANPGDAPHAGATEQTPGDEGKLRPEQEMGPAAGPAGAAAADATGRATGDPLSHGPVG
jgi:hypothetical protein